MSTEIGTIINSGSRGVGLSLTRYWGGEAGACLQLTAKQDDGAYGYVQLSASDIILIMPILKEIIDLELGRKKHQAESAIDKNRDLLKTIFPDMREVPEMAIAQTLLDFSALLVLGKKEIVFDQEYLDERGEA